MTARNTREWAAMHQLIAQVEREQQAAARRLIVHTRTGIGIGSAYVPRPLRDPQAISGPHRRHPVREFIHRRVEDALILGIVTALLLVLVLVLRVMG